MTTSPTLPKSRQQLILAVLMLCSLLIWLDNTVLSTTLETLADPVRGLDVEARPSFNGPQARTPWPSPP